MRRNISQQYHSLEKSLVCIVGSQNNFVKEVIIWKKFQNYKWFQKVNLGVIASLPIAKRIILPKKKKKKKNCLTSLLENFQWFSIAFNSNSKFLTVAYKRFHNPFLPLKYFLFYPHSPSLEFLFLIYSLFIFGCARVFIDVLGLSLFVVHRCGAQVSLFVEHGAWGMQFSVSCSAWPSVVVAPGLRVQAQQLWCTSFVALRHVGTSWFTTETHVLFTGRQILIH